MTEEEKAESCASSKRFACCQAALNRRAMLVLFWFYSWQLQIASRVSTCVSPFRLCRPCASLLHLEMKKPYELRQEPCDNLPIFWSMQQQARFVSNIRS